MRGPQSCGPATAGTSTRRDLETKLRRSRMMSRPDVCPALTARNGGASHPVGCKYSIRRGARAAEPAVAPRHAEKPSPVWLVPEAVLERTLRILFGEVDVGRFGVAGRPWTSKWGSSSVRGARDRANRRARGSFALASRGRET